jgi:ABC-type phosphate transport system substrate-binding protein
MMSRRGAFVLFALLAAAPAGAGDVAIIVHPLNPQHEVTLAELTRIFRLDRQYWPSGGKISLVLQAAGSDKETIVLRRIYNMNRGELRPFWQGKIFRGELTEPPRAFASDESVKSFVSQVATAIGFIDATLLDASVRALKIEGRAPGEPGYILSRSR